MNIKKHKKSIALVLAIVSVLTLAAGSLAYFTDRVNVDAAFKTAAVSDVIKVTTKDDGSDPDVDPGTDLSAKWEEDNPAEIIRPGDMVDLSYKLTNIGTCDIDVRETFILTSEVPIFEDGFEDPAWRLFTSYTEDLYGAHIGGAVVEVEHLNEYQIKYTIAPFTLEKDASRNLQYYTILDRYATNAFQDCTCTVEYLVELRQHADGLAVDEGWDAICTAEITFGGTDDYAAVPEA